MNYIGISAGFHDAAISVVSDSGKILFAGHSERYSKQKHDALLCPDIVKEAVMSAGHDYELHYYEKPWLKAIRQWRAGQKIGPLSVKKIITPELYDWFGDRPITTHSHHKSHAAADSKLVPTIRPQLSS